MVFFFCKITNINEALYVPLLDLHSPLPPATEAFTEFGINLNWIFNFFFLVSRKFTTAENEDCLNRMRG